MEEPTTKTRHGQCSRHFTVGCTNGVYKKNAAPWKKMFDPRRHPDELISKSHIYRPWRPVQCYRELAGLFRQVCTLNAVYLFDTPTLITFIYD